MNDSFTPVSISDKALKEVKAIMNAKSIPQDYGLRVGIQGAGCAGITYIVGFDKKKESDMTYLKEDVMILIDKKHVMYLVGVELDFIDEQDARGFTFNDPKAKDGEIS